MPNLVPPANTDPAAVDIAAFVKSTSLFCRRSSVALAPNPKAPPIAVAPLTVAPIGSKLVGSATAPPNPPIV